MIKLSGKVINGSKYGRKLGFPTANLDRRQYNRQKLKVKFGIWAGTAELKVKSKKLKVYKAAIVIGPLDNRRLPKIEAHLPGFKGNLYGKKITIALYNYIRPFRNFVGDEQLKKQINRDINKIKKYSL